MAEAQQQPLWHDHFEDALRDAVQAIGGPKKAASKLWPAKSIADAARLLNHCLDPERSEKLEPCQIVLLMRWGAENDCHSPMHYLADEIGYETPRPKNPDTERDRLQREFIAAQQQMAVLVQRMERFGGQS